MKKLLFCLAVAALGAKAADNDTAIVCLAPEESLLWKTVTAPAMSVSLDWPGGAAKAAVRVDGVVMATVTDTNVKSADIEFEPPLDAKGEKVVTIAVAYSDSTENTLAESSVKLGLVLGANNAGAIPFRNPSESVWHKLKSDAGVLPIPADTTAFTIDSIAATGYAAPGWYYWTGAGGEHALALTAGGVEYANTVIGTMGLTVTFR